jgi:chorismate lyase/3-hydroxybenzoate synthase
MMRRAAGIAAPVEAPPLAVAYVPASALGPGLPAGRVLAEIHYGPAPPGPGASDHPRPWIAMTQLAGPERVEVWTSPEPVEYRQQGSIRYACNREVLFGSLTQAVSADAFERDVRDAYREIFDLLGRERYPHLLRVWNHFPGISERADGLDRYQCFCRGRFESFERHFGAVAGAASVRIEEFLPSASAVGTEGGNFELYFIAGRAPGRHRENPRQMSAYHYPAKYGPRSPSFARATLKRWPDADYLYVSGTASIVGHASLHPEDPLVQVEETLRNLESLIESTAREEACRFRGLQNVTHFKVYLRHPADIGAVRQRLDALFPPAIERIYLQGEICRPDLLLEIEAIVRSG